MKTEPLRGFWTLAMVLNKVDFPIPFLPKTVTNFPFSIDKLIAEATIFCAFLD